MRSTTVVGLLAGVFLCAAGLGISPAAAAQESGGPHARIYVIFATVLNDHGFALYGARTRLRRSGEKKYRWEAVSDHQGELAFRVPPGVEYEMMVEARGFKTETRKIGTSQDNRVDLTIRMEPDGKAQKAPGDGGK